MTTAQDYLQYVASKQAPRPAQGFDCGTLPSHLFPFQREAVRRACEQGQYGLYEDCGLGKTAQGLAWAQAVVEHTGKPVLCLAPLAVGRQTEREGQRFNTPARYAQSMAGADLKGVTVTNYERLDAFDASAFGGVWCDESGILRNYSGPTTAAITAFCKLPSYLLLASATPAPNDYMELGTQVECLRVMTSHEMLARWFINDTSSMGKYRLKGHAQEAFWDFVAGIAACVGKPSDLGTFSDDGYDLPPCEEYVHTLDVDASSDRTADRSGQLSLLRGNAPTTATTLHREKRITLVDRARKVAELVTSEPDESWLVWVDQNAEDDELRRVMGVVSADAFGRAQKSGGALPPRVSVRGSDTIEAKERALLAFADGSIRVLVTKGSIAGFGLNYQHAARMVDIGVNFSFDSLYQRRRRMWRFGQRRTVHHHIVMAATERDVWNVVTRKAAAHEKMKVEMFAAMRRARERSDASAVVYRPTARGRLPEWLQESRRSA